MRATRAMICLGLMGVLATATCDDDSDDDKRSGQGEGPGQQPPQSGGATGIGLTLIAEGLTSPVTLTVAPDNSGRLFIVDQIGVVRVVTSDGTLQEEPFLDVRDLIVPLMPEYDERGLLGLAFHPYFKTNGRLFVYYTAPPRLEGYDNTSVVAEYHVTPATPGEQAQPVGVLLQEDQPQFNHEGGTLAFGPDDHLYVSIGDGGGRDDEGSGPPQQTPVFGHVDDWYPDNPGGNGQDITKNLLGDILRLDVMGTPGTYKIPADNPFVDRGKGEIWAYGFRNPYRFSFDMSGNHDLLLGDAGQNMWEEIDVVRKGGNYGWNVKEGTHCFSAEQPMTVPPSCPAVDPTTGEALVDPVIEIPNIANPMRGTAEGFQTIIGGHVYRGRALPQLHGLYVFGAFSTQEMGPAGAVYAASPRTDAGLWTSEKLTFVDRADGALGHFLLGFGQDRTGEVYVLTTDSLGPAGNTGRVYRLAAKAIAAQ
jgi:glucose/arabinose dehydrogenase